MTMNTMKMKKKRGRGAQAPAPVAYAAYTPGIAHASQHSRPNIIVFSLHRSDSIHCDMQSMTGVANRSSMAWIVCSCSVGQQRHFLLHMHPPQSFAVMPKASMSHSCTGRGVQTACGQRALSPKRPYVRQLHFPLASTHLNSRAT